MSKRVDEEPKQPFEYMAENKDSQQPGSGKRPLKQQTLSGAVGKKPKA